MNPDTLFSICNSIALLSWVLLALFPYKEWTSRFLIGVVISLLGLIYASIMIQIFNPDDFSAFSSLKGLMQLFKNEMLVLAGWVHYLAFDLMVGVYIVNNARKRNINALLVIPCLFFTFMMGPMGLLLYLLLRWAKTRQYFHNYI